MSPALLVLLALEPDAGSVQLTPQINEAFNRYAAATEARIARQVVNVQTFLYIETLPAARRDQIKSDLRGGKLFMERLETRDAQGNPIIAPGALIHHWVGDNFIPNATLEKVLEFSQDFNRHEEIYGEVAKSRLLSRQGNDFKIYYRLRKHKVITVTLDTEHEVHYAELDPVHWSSRSVSIRVQEVEDAGKPSEHDKPVGKDSGFLWRINSYWRFEEADGGVYVECESISLTRDIPSGLGWLITPFVTSIPRESLEHTLDSTRSAVLARLGKR
jgi:hypothetical protein